MGMHQSRCPECRKLRPKRDGGAGWRFINARLVCRLCAERHAEPPPRPAGLVRRATPGEIVDAEDVPLDALVRDGAGTYYMRRGRRGQVARGAGSWRAWGDVRQFYWFARGRFQVVAVDVPEAATALELQAVGEAFELNHGTVDFGEDGCAILTSAREPD